MKKVFKVIGVILLGLMVAFMVLVRCGKPTNAIITHAQETTSTSIYDITNVKTIIDEDDDYSENIFYCPQTFYNSNSNIFGNNDPQIISRLYLYDTYNNTYYANLVIKNAYMSSYGLYLENDSISLFLCYYQITGSLPYIYKPYFELLSNYGGILTIPIGYSYSWYDVNNVYNITSSSLFRTTDLYFLTNNCNNYILLCKNDDSQNSYNVGYNVGYNDGQQAIFDNPTNYDLYNQLQYETYGNEQFGKGQMEGDLASRGFRVMLSTIFNAPYQILQPILNFKLLGVNLWNLFSFIISLFLIIFIVKLFIGRGGK